MQMEVKEQIERLRNELHRHNYNYYVLNAPEISDQEFDRMMRELQDLEAAHPEFDDPGLADAARGERPEPGVRAGAPPLSHVVVVQYVQQARGGRLL